MTLNYVMLTTSLNDTVRPYHRQMPLIVRPENYNAWLGNDSQKALSQPDHAPLERFQN